MAAEAVRANISTSVSPDAFPLITTSVAPMTTTSAMSGLLTVTREIWTGVWIGSDRYDAISMRVTGSAAVSWPAVWAADLRRDCCAECDEGRVPASGAARETNGRGA
jgi:hypothetical protein